MSGCDDHIGAQREALVAGLREKGAGNDTDPFWHRWKPTWRRGGARWVRGNEAVNVTVHMVTRWWRGFITTQADGGESAGFLLLRVVTNAR